MVLPRVRDGDGHLEVLGADRLEAQMADDELAVTVVEDSDEPFTVDVVGPTERPGRAVGDAAGAAVEPGVEAVTREGRVEALERHDIVRADGPDRDARRKPRIVHGLSVPGPERQDEGRTA
jgi:hypothetical protein